MKRLLLLTLLSGLSGCGDDDESREREASVVTGATIQAATLPAGWQSQDIGAVAHSGHAEFSGGTWTICGSGDDIWGTGDAFHFAYRTLSGDGELVARVASLDPTDSWAKAGVMIRESLSSGSAFAMTVVTPSNGTSFQYRTQTAQPAGLTWGPASGAPFWVRISRNGTTFSGAGSSDGVHWTTIGSVSIAMGSTVYMGLCVTAHNTSAVACSTIDSVTAGSLSPQGGVTITNPVNRIVYQRSNSNTAIVPVTGTCPAGPTAVQARATARVAGQGASTGWQTIDTSFPDGHFDGSITLAGGWYSLEVRALVGETEIASAAVERVGVGEVFIVVGHSVAHGSEQNIEGATDDRVGTIPVDNQSPLFQNYNSTADPQYLHPAVFGHFGSGVKPAPYGYGNYFWSRFAEHLAQQRNVPVVVYNAAFGGTSLEHWAKSSQGIWFEHGFVNASIRMPYINLYNTLKHYIPLTGIRAVLSDQGQNDWPEPNVDVVVQNYQTWVNQARTDLGHGALAIVVNRQTPGTSTQIRQAQEQMIQTADCFAGPDYDTLLPEDRTDGIHLSLSGQSKAALMWANSLSDAFFATSVPYLRP